MLDMAVADDVRNYPDPGLEGQVACHVRIGRY
jgi:hypothetical protein